MSIETAKDVIQHFERLKGRRYNHEALWQEIADFMFPLHANILTQRTPGQYLRARQWSSEPELALGIFAAAMHNLMTGEGYPWFRLRAEDVRRDRIRRVREYLELAERVCYAVFNGPRSRFQMAAQETYQQFGAFGISPMMAMDRPGDVPLYMTFPLSESCAEKGPDGGIDTLLRCYPKSARELLQDYPKSAGTLDQVRKAYEKHTETEFNCIHAIRPRKEAVLNRRHSRGMPWESVVVLKETMTVLEEGGFRRFPAVVPRWMVATGETYGRGPGHRALPDTRLLMKVVETGLKAYDKLANPPLNVPEGSYSNRLKLHPGAMNYYNTNPASPMHQVDASAISAVETVRAQAVDAIRRAFYTDLFSKQAPVTEKGAVTHMSATQSSLLEQEARSLIGPIFSRLKTEFLTPLLFRTLDLLVLNGKLPAPPPELRGAEVLAEYISPLAVAQEAGDIHTIIEGIQVAATIGAVSPEALDLIDGDGAAAKALHALRMPQEALRDREAIDGIRRARAERDLAAEEAGLAMQRGRALKDTAAAQEALAG